MEVHHPHQPAHKKKWTGYLLEFLMLFLAVFLGFIAENIREHIVEKNRAKGLSAALITDLQKDSAQLTTLRNYRNIRVQEIDSFNILLNQPFSQADRVSFYRLAKKIQSNQDFTPATGTANELKSAGYLRYFIHSRLATFLAEYETIYIDCALDEKIEFNTLYERYHNALLKAIDAISLDSLFNYPQLIRGKGVSPISPENLSELKKVVVMIKYMNSVFIRPTGQFEKLKAKEIEIMQYLQQNF
jgi:hypothetical protein